MPARANVGFLMLVRAELAQSRLLQSRQAADINGLVRGFLGYASPSGELVASLGRPLALLR